MVYQQLIANSESMFWRLEGGEESLFCIQLVVHHHFSNNRHNDDHHHDNRSPKKEKNLKTTSSC